MKPPITPPPLPPPHTHHHHLLSSAACSCRGLLAALKPQAAPGPKIDPAGGTQWNQISLRVCGPGRKGRTEQQLLMDNLHAEPPHVLFGASVSSVQRAGGPNFPKGGTVKPGGFPCLETNSSSGAGRTDFSLLDSVGFLLDAVHPETKCTRGCSARCELGVKSSVKKRAGPPGVVNQTLPHRGFGSSVPHLRHPQARTLPRSNKVAQINARVLLATRRGDDLSA